jgi:hypothetical protein
MKRSLCLMLLLAAATGARADELAGAARGLVERHADAVVILRLVISERFSMAGFGGEDSESVQEVPGVVIQPDGLIVTALSATDPGAMYSGLFDMFGEEDGMSIETQISRVEILRSDGSEVPASVVLRDKDLDLAFLRPNSAPESPWPHIALDGDAVPQPFEHVIVPYRLGKVAQRACTASITRVLATLQKPRMLHLLEVAPTGTAAFTADGRLVGVVVMRQIAETGGASDFSIASMSSMIAGPTNMAFVVVPAAQVRESASQAPDKAAPAPAAGQETPAP